MITSHPLHEILIIGVLGCSRICVGKWKNRLQVLYVILDFDKSLLTYIYFVFIVIGLFCFKGSQQKQNIEMQGMYYLTSKIPFLYIIWESAHHVCLFRFFVPLEHFKSYWNDNITLPMKDCKFWPIFNTHADRALRFFNVPHLCR